MLPLPENGSLATTIPDGRDKFPLERHRVNSLKVRFQKSAIRHRGTRKTRKHIDMQGWSTRGANFGLNVSTLIGEPRAGVTKPWSTEPALATVFVADNLVHLFALPNTLTESPSDRRVGTLIDLRSVNIHLGRRRWSVQRFDRHPLQHSFPRDTSSRMLLFVHVRAAFKLKHYCVHCQAFGHIPRLSDRIRTIWKWCPQIWRI